MLGRVQPQKSFGDEALDLHVSDSHFLVEVSVLVDWAEFDGYWPMLYGTTGKPSSDPLVCFKCCCSNSGTTCPTPNAKCNARITCPSVAFSAFRWPTLFQTRPYSCAFASVC